MKNENNPHRNKSGGYKTAILLTSLMFFQVLASSSLIVSASTTPPSSQGDWTINADEVAYLNSTDQALVQGDVHIYGELHIDGGSLFLWGSSDGQRELRVFPGGILNVTNGGTIGSYTSIYYDFAVDDLAHISVTDSRIEKATSIQSSSLNMTLSNVHFEDTRLIIIDNYEDGEFDPIQNTIGANWLFDDLRFLNSTMTPVLNLNSASGTLSNWTATFSDVNISVLSTANYAHTIEVGGNWYANLIFDGLEVTDDTRQSSSAYNGNAANSRLFMHDNLVADLEIKNSLFYDSPEHKAIYSAGDLILNNVTIEDVFHPDQAGDWYEFAQNNCCYASDTVTRIVQANGEITADQLNIENSGVMTQIKTGYKMELCSGSNSTSNWDYCYHGGPDFYCHAIHTSGTLILSNSNINGNCLAQIEYHGYRIFNGGQDGCSSQNDDLDEHYFDGHWADTSGTSYPNDNYCKRYEAYAVSSGNAHIYNSTIESNAKITVWFSGPSYNYYQHGTVHTGGVMIYGNSSIDNSTISNNADSYIGGVYQSNTDHRTLSSYQVVSKTASDDVVWINNSFLNTTMTPDVSNHDSIYTQTWGAFQHWYSFGIHEGTAFITDSEINYYTGAMSHAAVAGDINPGNGEVVRRWSVEVHVVDPDGVFTPYANVSAYENNGVWNIGTWSTGPHGSSVNFIARQYSMTESSNYSYTPHSIQVTMTNYSNSTSVNITEPSVITVYDPTPDAFPGDTTQDWDTDGDGYGDNISGNNPDLFPNDPTQWNDTDGDGYGDNYTYTINFTTGLRVQNGDAFVYNSSQWSDLDGDGYGDNYTWTMDRGLRDEQGDAFPYDSTQWSDDDGDGYGDNPNGSNPDWDSADSTQWEDTDGDGYGDNYTFIWNNATQLRDNQNGDAFISDSTQWSDRDGDGHGDHPNGTSPDEFPYDNTQWYDGDQDGLGDNQSGNNPDPYLNDSDNDGYNNSEDEFPWNPTQWEDNDNDGLGDNQSGTAADPYLNDTDNDGYNNSVDAFPYDPTQWVDADNDGYGDNPNGTNADPSLNDTDNDGVTNDQDDFPLDHTQTTDSDGDGYGDNASGFNPDAFPNNPAQWADTDGDGYGDNMFGSQGDMFPSDPTQWNDTDGDGYGDNPLGHAPDAFPTEPSQWSDSDGDGWGDNSTGTDPDIFPQDPTQWADRDGDGYGDNSSGNMPDIFPDDNRQWSDVDNDGYGDNYYWSINQATGLRIQEGDAFYTDSSQYSDLDGDGYGDNSQGYNPDQFPTDSFQHTDSDGDGLGDNYRYDISQVTGLRENQEGDAFPSDSTQWSDTDGDGYGDNPNGNNPDWDPDDPTQWVDADNDGLGDNPLGNNPDPTPGDGDNDGVIDLNDAFPNDPNEVFDTDGDGIGDNADTDDDGDGWDDVMELNCNTSPINSDSTPLDSDGDGECNWNDSDDDNDGVEDSRDSCPTDYGNSSFDVLGCPDTDGDTVSDNQDTHPQNPYLSIDSDFDGYQDPVDPFPSDGTQWADFDNDGFGDNQQGNNPDPYLDDSDNDGVINQIDPFPLDPTQYEDIDKDGLGDNPSGNNPDPFPNDSDNDGYSNDIDMFRFDSTQWEDSDGDGYGDNPLGNFGDQFPDDPTQCCDRDGDGWGDNINGSNPDQFPDEITQWIDLDGDGLGDNPSGKDGDPYPNDSDNDGVANDEDIWPEDPDRSLDWDGDNISVEEEGLILDRVSQSHVQGIIAIILIALVVGIIIGTVFKIPRRN